MREFWLRLVKDFENLNVHEGLKKKLSDLERTCSKNQLQNEDLARQVQRCTRMLEDKTQEIVRLTEALRNAESEAWEAEQESQRHRQRAARLRASVCFNIRIFRHRLVEIFGHRRPWQSRIRNTVLRSNGSKPEPLQEDYN